MREMNAMRVRARVRVSMHTSLLQLLADLLHRPRLVVLGVAHLLVCLLGLLRVPTHLTKQAIRFIR